MLYLVHDSDQLLRRCPSEYQVRLQQDDEHEPNTGGEENARFRLVVERFTDFGKCVSLHSPEWHALLRREPLDTLPVSQFPRSSTVSSIIKLQFECWHTSEERELQRERLEHL